MSTGLTAPIDCDVHIAVPGNDCLMPYLDAYWRDQVVARGIEALDLATYPPKTPLAGRPDWRPANGKPGTDRALLGRAVFDRLGARLAIGHAVYGGQAALNADFAVAICRAVNEWVAREWLDREPRLRASIAIPMQDPVRAVAEIERCAADRRFVQVLMLASGDAPYGHRQYWPIYEAACAHGLPVGLHPGHSGRFAATYVGWPSYYIEDYAAQSQALQAQLLSLVFEGVFTRFPALKLVLLESGVSWLPGLMWRADDTWRAMRGEVPWVEESPSEIVRRHVRLTAQPFDAPRDAATIAALLEQFAAEEMLLYASDFPHWHFDGEAVLPPGFSPGLVARMAVGNPLDTYPRLQEGLR